MLSDPARSEAVLIGVHEYATLENLPAVAQNLHGLRDTLTDPGVWGLPAAACTVISQPSSVGEVLDTVRERARRAEDTLLVYYAGHGLTDPHTDELYLAMPESDREREYTSLRYEYLRRAVLDQQARAQRTVVILDCCYSGRALLGKMSASTHIADQAVVAGTCLLTASAETRPALSPPGERYTAFTGELITTLADGVPDQPDPLDMDTLYRHVHRTLAGKSRPLPQQRNRNLGGFIAIARNRAATPEPPPPLAGLGEAEKRLAQIEQRAEELRLENERLRLEAERRARETVETAQRLASAVTATADPNFKPFWFAVPVPRPLYGEDGSLQPVAELLPGTWYLALELRGKGLVARSDDGEKRGLILDLSGIQRGDDEGDIGFFVAPGPSAPGSSAPGSSATAPSAAAKKRTEETVRMAERLADAVGADPDPGFLMFWFAVPVRRPLMSDSGVLEEVGELVPGTWYLAVERRGEGLLAQTDEGLRGILLDTSGIQRG
ncbi:caspase domain-containing protein [Streptomyces sp. NPDC050658]|uniref:caspase domain-containing protein n=1 Tax=Streptomyces sp. NPDC050658 TaxID=3365633 RepID=UPI0037AA1837